MIYTMCDAADKPLVTVCTEGLAEDGYAKLGAHLAALMRWKDGAGPMPAGADAAFVSRDVCAPSGGPA